RKRGGAPPNPPRFLHLGRLRRGAPWRRGVESSPPAPSPPLVASVLHRNDAARASISRLDGDPAPRSPPRGSCPLIWVACAVVPRRDEAWRARRLPRRPRLSPRCSTETTPPGPRSHTSTASNGRAAASSPDDLDAVRSIAIEVGNTPVGEEGHVPVICGLSRCNKKDIDAAWEAVRHARRPRIHTFIATSEIHMEHKLRKTPEQVVAIAREMVAYARSLGCPDVEFSPEDAGRLMRISLKIVLGT
ncbi:unnamed protein product, partial [Urochloa humidicola]